MSQILIPLFLFLVFTTLVGHGIWVLLAWLLGFRTPRERRQCPFCNRSTVAGERCDWCGRKLGSPLAVEMDDLAAVERQLRRFARNKTIKPAAVEQLLARLAAYRERLIAPAPKPVAVPQVVASPPAEEEPTVLMAEVLEPEPLPVVPVQPAPMPVVVPPPVIVAPPAAPSDPLELPWLEALKAAKRQATAPAKPQAAVEVPVKPQAAAEVPVKPQAPAAVPVKRQAPAAVPVKPQAPPAPREPEKSWSEVLAAFMEERNIRWGELVGGLLFICSSVALVVSLWGQLKEIPYFQSLVFVAVVSAVFGLGLYAHYRWKLRATSQGMLVIASLSVPLSFVAMAALSRETWTFFTLIPEAIALGIFAVLVGLAAQVLVGPRRLGMVLGIVGNSAMVLVAARWIDGETSPPAVLGVGAAAVGLFAATMTAYLYPLLLVRRAGQRLRLDEQEIVRQFTMLGIAAFAMAVAVGMLVARATGQDLQSIRPLLSPLSVLAALAASPFLAVGLTVQRGTAHDRSLGPYRVAGTSVALAGVVLMLASVGMAWPRPDWLITVGLLNAAVLIASAFLWRRPALHVGAIACAAVAYVTAFHRLFGDLAAEPSSLEMLRLAVSARSGTALAGLFVALAAVSEVLGRWGHRRHGLVYLGGCAAVAVVGLSLVTAHAIGQGGDDALRAAILYAVYGVTSLALVARWRRVEFSYLGLGLLAAGPLWLLAYWPEMRQIGPLWAMIPAIEALLIDLAAIALLRRGGRWSDWLDLEGSSSGATAGLPGSAEQARVGKPPVAPNGSVARPGLDKWPQLSDIFRIPMAHVAEVAAVLGLTLAVTVAVLRPDLHHETILPVVTAACLAAVYFIFADQYRTVWRTWTASTIALAGTIHALVVNYDTLVSRPWLVALLGHATAMLGASLVVEYWSKRTVGRTAEEPGDCPDFRSTKMGLSPSTVFPSAVFVRPLADAALLSSALTVPALLWSGLGDTTSLAVCLFWLAVVWLVLAWQRCDRFLFAAHQIVLTAAAVTATRAGLEQAGWITDAVGPLAIANLPIYGIVLGLLSIGWILVRSLIETRSVSEAPPSGSWAGPWTTLLAGRWSVDRAVRHAVVVMQFGVIAACLLGGVPAELNAQWPGTQGAWTDAVGPNSWLLLAVLAMMLALSLWERWRDEELLSTILLAGSLAGLVAGQFIVDLAVASAVRWSAAVVLLGCSAAMWQGRRLLAAAKTIDANIELSPYATQIARSLLLIVTLLPVLGLTVVAGMNQVGGIAPGGPAAGSLFHQLGPTASYLVPLVLVIASLVGHGIALRSTPYVFSAGLVVELAVLLGYTLRTKLAGGAFDVGFQVTLLQLFTITAGLWAITWLLVRQRLDVWRETPAVASRLMTLQFTMALVGNIVLVSGGVLLIALAPSRSHAWTIAAGHWLGWVALVLPVVGAWLRGRLRPNTVGLFGIAVMGLLASTISGLGSLGGEPIDPIWGYRTLMLGWAVYALLVAATAWSIAAVRLAPTAEGPPQALLAMAAVWVRIAALLAVALGLKAAVDQPGEELWAAAAIATASTAAATMAVWRRREGWAFAAALGVNLAASLVVWHFEPTGLENETLVRLFQANVIASAAVALAWLSVRRRLYAMGDLSLRHSPLLAAQIALSVLGNLAILVPAVVQSLDAPREVAAWTLQAGQAPGWLALALTAAAAAWYLRQILPERLIDVIALTGLGIGVLASRGILLLDISWLIATDWLAYHVLHTSWIVVAGVLLAAAILGQRLRLRCGPADQGRTVWLFATDDVRLWLSVIGTLAVALALIHAPHDPDRPWWGVGTVATAGALSAIVALWLRQAAPVYVCSVLINTVGMLIWWAFGPGQTMPPHWEPEMLTSLIQTNAVCLAAGSVFWSLSGSVVRWREDRPWPIPVTAAGLAVDLGTALAAAVVVIGLGGDLLNRTHLAAQPLDAIAVASLAAAAVATWILAPRALGRRLYVLGLVAIGMGLWARDFPPRQFFWSGATELAAFTLVTAIAAWVMSRLPIGNSESKVVFRSAKESPLSRSERRQYAGRRAPWFSAAQAVVIALAAATAIWVAVDFGFDRMGEGFALMGLSGRMAGPSTLLMLLGAAIVMAWNAKQEVGAVSTVHRAGWQYAALALGLAFNSGVSLSLMSAEIEAPWLHRAVLVMVSSLMLTMIATLGLRVVVSHESDWMTAGRRAAPVLGATAIAMLLAALAQEAAWYMHNDGIVPTERWAIALVLAALVAMAAACIYIAVRSERDPSWGRLPTCHAETGQIGNLPHAGQLYVYVAEVLLVLVGLHVRMTMPWLFGNILRQFWMFLVMGLAFGGAGLSEWFRRRRMPVLAEPLEKTCLWLPLLPALGFWFMPEAEGRLTLVGQTPLVWLAVSLFYSVMAGSGRSGLCWLLAVVTGNVGIWVALYQSRIVLVEHPQLWLIPPALAGLVAEYLNRGRLTESQSSGLRYFLLGVIYVSSTAEMYIVGVGEDLRLPLVLMVLSVAGVLLGMLLRVRSFLFLGMAFLLVDVVSILWYAAVDLRQTWIWYVTGITLGAAIIALFAVFEKRRNDVLAAVERLKEWKR